MLALILMTLFVLWLGYIWRIWTQVAQVNIESYALGRTIRSLNR